MAVQFDDDEIRAAESRLRQAGWVAPHPALSKGERDTQQRVKQVAVKPRRPPPDKGFGSLDDRVRQAGLWLAANLMEAGRPLRPFIAEKFDLSFDDAGRAVAEAERLSGATL